MNSKLIISLTSIPPRIGLVDQTIRSLMNQTAAFGKIVLWLGKDKFPKRKKNLPGQLLELQSDKFEIKWCEDVGPHTKLIPALREFADKVIVTVDDDELYSPVMLEKLVRAHESHPEDVVCHKATKFLLHKDGAFRTIGGGKDVYPGASSLNKLCGVAGVLYPAKCFHTDVCDVKTARKVTPTNDDQWFWAHAVLSGRKVRVVEDNEPVPPRIPGSQVTSLCSRNDFGPKLFWRDFQALCACYPEFDSALRQEWIDQREHHNDNMQCYRSQMEAWYWQRMSLPLNLDSPRGYNEKIQWLKIFDATPIKTMLADKFAVRAWVAERIGDKYVIPVIGRWNSSDEIDFDKLPSQYVLKCTHGSGMNVIVKDAASADCDEIRKKLGEWMRTDYSKPRLELQYRDVPHQIIAEPFLQNASGDLYDYKLWCFDGRVEYIEFLAGRNLGRLEMVFFDRDWVRQPFVHDHPMVKAEIPRPDNLDKMISLAEKLALGFSHVRVDFYRMDDGTVYFGEMTFSSNNGLSRWNDPTIDLKLGAMIKLPELAYNLDTGENFPSTETHFDNSVFEKHMEQRKARSAMLREQEASVRALGAKVEELRAGNEQKDAVITELEKALEARKAETGELRVKAGELRASNNEKKERIAKLREALDGKRAELDELHCESVKKDALVDGLRKSVEELRAKINELRASGTAKKERILKLQKILADQAAKIGELRAANGAKKSDLAAANKRIKTLESELKKLKEIVG